MMDISKSLRFLINEPFPNNLFTYDLFLNVTFILFITFSFRLNMGENVRFLGTGSSTIEPFSLSARLCENELEIYKKIITFLYNEL